MQSYLINKNTTRFQITFKGSKETRDVEELFSRQQQLCYVVINFIYNVICYCQNFYFQDTFEPQTRVLGRQLILFCCHSLSCWELDWHPRFLPCITRAMHLLPMGISPQSQGSHYSSSGWRVCVQVTCPRTDKDHKLLQGQDLNWKLALVLLTTLHLLWTCGTRVMGTGRSKDTGSQSV